MPQILVLHHKVEDYSKFKKNFDEHKPMRRAAGERSYRLFHTEGDPNNLVFLFDWDTVERFQEYAQSKALREAQKDAGLIDQPEILVLKQIETGTL
jgi:quinol monooxygenase YgiN